VKIESRPISASKVSTARPMAARKFIVCPVARL
jgi:hypothetical protein